MVSFIFFVNNKPYFVARHYRNNPNLTIAAHDSWDKIINNYAHWQLKSGK